LRDAVSIPLDVRAVVDALPLPALLIGLHDGLLAANDAARRLFAPAPGLAGKSFKELAVSYEVSGLRLALERVKVGEPGTTLSATVRAGDAREVPLDLTLVPVPGPNGGVGAVLLTAADSSDFRGLRGEYESLRAEHATMLARQDQDAAELQALNEELEAANVELRAQVRQLAAAEEADIRKNQFLAMLAHELRNPLGAAVNALHIIHRFTGGDRQIEHAVRIAERQLEHEARLLDDLLDVSRIILGKIAVETRVVDLRATIGAAVESADHVARGRALDVRVHLPDEPLAVAGDATRLEQCLGNLLSNAAKFTPAGGTVTVRARREGGRAVVSVSDSGIGIPDEMLGRVFDLFMQGDPSLGRAQGGLGIGLTLVKYLVELQGGSVVARSAGPGKGSEFEIRLPLTEQAQAIPAPPTVAAARSRRVLVVEDNRDAREMLRTVLELNGHTVLDAGDGAAAIRLAGESAPDVVVLDIGLPDLDGFEVARRIRARLGATTRLVGLSGYGDEEARRTGRDAGFDVHLVKPVSPEVLLRSLDAT
jgi:signal transduction histidine kinase/CheY-like chemotaxis protein